MSNIFEQIVDNIRYTINIRDLEKMRFPLYTPQTKAAYSIKSGKTVGLFVKYSFTVQTDETIYLRGELYYNKKKMGIKAKARVDINDIYNALMWSISMPPPQQSIIFFKSIDRVATAIARTLYDCFLKINTEDVVLFGVQYKHPSFLLTRKNEVIGVCDDTTIDKTQDGVIIVMRGLTGTYMSAFKKGKDKNVRVVTLNKHTGNKMILAEATVTAMNGDNIEVAVNKLSDSNIGVAECQKIFKGGNYKEYFLNKVNETEGDLFGIFD